MEPDSAAQQRYSIHSSQSDSMHMIGHDHKSIAGCVPASEWQTNKP